MSIEDIDADIDMTATTDDAPDPTTTETPAIPVAAVDAEDFDFAAFVDGARAARRAVRVFLRADLAAEIDQLVYQVENADEGTDIQPLKAQIRRTQEQFLKSGRWFILEKKSSEWVRAFRKRLAKDLTLKITDERTGSPDDELTAGIHQLAEQIVTPSNVTSSGLRALYDTNEGELAKLLYGMGLVNRDLAEQVLTRDFSELSSITTPAG